MRAFLRRPATALALALAAMLLLAWYAYLPGLAGGFLFDDFANLPALGATGPVDDAATFWRYITSGTADPTGRPIALLSFLIDANDWPADAHPFKRTSVLLHLLNGTLLVWLLLLLARALRIPESAGAKAAVLGAALWLLHPLLVSTTLYVVQREAMLPTTFILPGLIGYLSGRQRALHGQRRGAWIAAISIVLGTFLGVLSKANGALLPLLAWLIEVVLRTRSPVEHDSRAARSFLRMRVWVLVVPSALILTYLVRQAFNGFVHGVDDIRPWTLGERLLTEARIIVDYLSLLWLPRPYTAGLFNDAYPISTSLLAPGSTLPCILLLATLVGGAIAVRKRYPTWSLAILFFFVAHIMESSVLPLELYFEHRNYVPAMLMFWPLALWLSGARAEATYRSADMRFVRIALGVALPLAMATLTWLRADLWGSPQDQAIIWARMNPASPRAQAYAAQMEMARGKNREAEKRLERAIATNPDDTQVALNLIGARCISNSLSAADIEHAKSALRSEPNTGRLGYDWFVRSLPVARAGSCKGLDLEVLDELLQAASTNKRAQKIPGRRQDVLHMRGRIALLRGDTFQAAAYFDDALQADLRPGAALNQAATLAEAGEPGLALRHLGLLERIWTVHGPAGNGMPMIHRWVLDRQGYWLAEIAHLRHALQDEESQRAESAHTASLDPVDHRDERQRPF